MQQTFRALQDGLYRVTAQGFTCVHTGRYETVVNPARRFFELWKPRYVVQEVIETVPLPVEVKTVRLKKGEAVIAEALVPK